MLQFINTVLLHPYTLALYGVLLWQIENWLETRVNFREFIKKSRKNTYRSLIWVGIVVVFDDEIMAEYNDWAEMDYQEIPLYFYTIAGFFIDFIRDRFIDRINKKNPNIS